MVTNDGRNNIISVAVIAGFSIMILAFIFTFVGNMEKATRDVSTQVDKAVNNITTTTVALSAEVRNMTRAVNELLVVQNEQADRSKEALATFIQSSVNNTNGLIDVVNDLNKDSNASRAAQTEMFVSTLEKSQNQTAVSQNLTQYRNELLENQTKQLDHLIFLLNMSLTPNVHMVNTTNSN